jgi:phytoene dehydrogenase-like protein
MTGDGVDVIVIGAGLAGLRCAGVLADAGCDVRIWEREDDVGGRVRTDAVDGFLCDRGFQVLNPAYPELQRAVDVSALDLQPFAKMSDNNQFESEHAEAAGRESAVPAT